MPSITSRTLAAAITLLAARLPAQLPDPLPLKYSGPPTVAAITPGDLMTRLYKYADDSMMGRDVGTIYHLKAVAYVESELKKLGLKPGGTNGSFYQDFTIWKMKIDPASNIVAGGKTMLNGDGFLIQPGAILPSVNGVQVMAVGNMYDTLTTLDTIAVKGKILLRRPVPLPTTDTAVMRQIRSSASYKAYLRAGALSLGSLSIQGDSLSKPLINAFTGPFTDVVVPVPGGSPWVIPITNDFAATLFGAPAASLQKGQISAPISIDVRISKTAQPNPGRNVIAILPGTDPKLKGEYVAIGGHSDHIGFDSLPRVRGEHDSLKIWNTFARPAGAEGGRTTPLTSEEWTTINSQIAELRKIYPPRPDSISNGADDDGTGSVSVLEIAEAFAKGAIKPKRSVIFVWHAGEEHGMWGSGYFMDNPTVPRDSIVAQLNIDMVGRGAATDVTGQAKGPTNAAGTVTGPGTILHGGDHYLQLVGSRRLSTELGDIVEKTNTEKQHGFVFDYNIDADGHQQNIYCRSDHWSYAKWGVPVVFFTTGGHADYHQVTDEPQYIRYNQMAEVDKLIFDVAMNVANLDHRVVVDKTKPNPAPALTCKQ